MSHVTHERVTSHTFFFKYARIWRHAMSQSQLNESHHQSRLTYERVMSRTSFSKFARNLREYARNLRRSMAQSHMNESHHQSRHTYERDMSRTSLSKNARNLRRAMAQSALKAPHGFDESSVRRHVTRMMSHVTYE